MNIILKISNYCEIYNNYYANPIFYMMSFQGMCLNFDCVVVMLLVIRNLITQLRKIGLASILPLDENIAVHKHVGYIIFFNAIVHTGGHFVNFRKISCMIMDILIQYNFFVLVKR